MSFLDLALSLQLKSIYDEQNAPGKRLPYVNTSACIHVCLASITSQCNFGSEPDSTPHSLRLHRELSQCSLNLAGTLVFSKFLLTKHVELDL